MEENKKTVSLTQAEYEELQALRERKQKEEAEARGREEREAWRKLSKDWVTELFPKLKECSERLASTKAEVFTTVQSILEMKSDLFGTKPSQNSHNFTSHTGRQRIRIGYNQRDGWDDTVEDGVAMVKNYISDLARDEESKKLVDIILDLLSKDEQGNLKADKVLQLERYALQSQDEDFIRGVEVIKESYRPERSKFYVRAEEKDSRGKWVNIPLVMTEA